MALFSSGAKLLLTDSGSLASSSGCCCTPDDDPDRLVLCCLGGMCVELSALECQFLGGSSVGSCAECVPIPPDTGPSSDCRSMCCDHLAGPIDVLLTVFVNDPTGGGGGRAGRLGEKLAGQAQVTLDPITFGSGCGWRFSDCVPLGLFGNYTRLRISFGVSRRPEPPLNNFGEPISGNYFCQWECSELEVNVATCGFFETAKLFCQSFGFSAGGSVGSFISPGPPVGDNETVSQSSFTGYCKGFLSSERVTVVRWANFPSQINAPFLVTGSPKTRDIDETACESVSAVFIDEETHTVITRIALAVL